MGSSPTSCSGYNGSAWAVPSGGSGIYSYLWNTGVTGSTNLNLAAGNYTVTVNDGGGCSATASASVISPPSITGEFAIGTANCIGCNCKEWIMVRATGGISPYTYTWQDGFTRRYRNQLCPGAYTITISDKNGCNAIINLTAP